MDYESFMEVIRKRRSIRAFKPDPVPDEVIEKIIEAAKWAPTGANTQLFEFIVVRDPDLKKQINTICNQAMDFAEPPEKPMVPQNFLIEAPVLIIVLGDPRFCEAWVRGWQREEIFHASLSAAIENMHLAATALGLGGSVWKTVSISAEIKIKDLLRIPQLYTVKTIMPVGYPKVTPNPPKRREVIVHNERYNPNKFRSEAEIENLIKEYTILGGDLGKFRVF
jgi:nitroreductase